MNGKYDKPLDTQTIEFETKRVSFFLGKTLDSIIALSLATKNSELLRIETTGVVPIIEHGIFLGDDKNITQCIISSVTPIAGNVYDVGIAIPLDYSFDDDTPAILQRHNMSINGSLTDEIFEMGPTGNKIFAITRVIGSMILSTQGDDGLFGNLPRLEYSESQYFRKLSDDADRGQNLFLAINNGFFGLEGYDVRYTDRSGGQGNFGMQWRVTFNGRDKSGIPIFLYGELNEKFITAIRADLTTIRYGIKVQGYFAKSRFSEDPIKV